MLSSMVDCSNFWNKGRRDVREEVRVAEAVRPVEEVAVVGERDERVWDQEVKSMLK